MCTRMDSGEKIMYGPIKVLDHNIVAINHQDATIVYRKGKELHQIDLKACAESFQSEYSRASGNCVGFQVQGFCKSYSRTQS